MALSTQPESSVTKSGREIMEIREAFDLTHSANGAATLAGFGPKTVARYVELRAAVVHEHHLVPIAPVTRRDHSGRRSHTSYEHEDLPASPRKPPHAR